MHLSALLVAFVSTATVAYAKEPWAGITFYSDMYRQGKTIECPKARSFDVCYNLDKVAHLGLSSGVYNNADIFLKSFSVTLYSGPGCNGRFDRWSFQRGYFDKPYYIEYFQSLNDNVRSFKIANFETSTTSGWAREDEESKFDAQCDVY
ncbi:hypothetical protein FBU30_001704 [Linnemannia zychae]|nr:hypothetical protein FBU30_001704 [Linnemannia zychae]